MQAYGLCTNLDRDVIDCLRIYPLRLYQMRSKRVLEGEKILFWRSKVNAASSLVKLSQKPRFFLFFF